MLEKGEFQTRFDGYRVLMPNRVQQILLVSTVYDAFVLEEDGPLGERIWDQYVEMRLTMTPRLRRASSAAEALEFVAAEPIDLVILMTRIPGMDTQELAVELKRVSPALAVILIATDPAELRSLSAPEDRGAIDRVFLWNNDPQLFLAIIKLVEDRLNVDHDTERGGVGVILVVEDSVADYSSFLPDLYRAVMRLTRDLMAQGLNHLHRQLRLRLRAKVLLAESYEEAVALFERYRSHLLGIISDVEFARGGHEDKEAGLALARHVRAVKPDLPFLLQSSEAARARERALVVGVAFLDKSSGARRAEFHGFLSEYMGFGDFVFRLPDGAEVDRARTIDELVQKLRTIPEASLFRHAERNHFSTWLIARAQVRIASRLRPRHVSEFPDAAGLRAYIIDTIEDVQADFRSDVVSRFSPSALAHSNAFMHLGEGSMGGKGRGIAFLPYLLTRTRIAARFPGVRIDVPQTVVIGAEEFSRFVDDHGVRGAALSGLSVSDLRARYLDEPLNENLVTHLRSFVAGVRGPLAIRSSSLLEDSHLQPFAGLYTTVMLPNDDPCSGTRLRQLLTAVKLVWLSTFNDDAKAYFRSTAHRFEDEQMAVLIQRMVGRRHGDHFYPTFSGVAQSFNFYPIAPMRADDGVAEVALGLGKTVVEGGASLRFCPAFPSALPQYPAPREWLRSSQRRFYALRLDGVPEDWVCDSDATLEHADLSLAERHGELAYVASTYYADDQVIREGVLNAGPRVVTFAPVLKHGTFPLGELLVDVLATCREAFGCAVEIEFAGNLGAPDPSFSLLQVRPFITSGRRENVCISEQERDHAWCRTGRALGNGVWTSLFDVVYVRPETFDRACSRLVAEEVSAFNHALESEGRRYVLIGFGRWGSFDPWLGIGVTWSQISGVAALVEAGRPDFPVDPSQGTHFFQNLTSLGVGYLSVSGTSPDSMIDWEWLESQTPQGESAHLRHLRFDAPIELKIDGRTGRAVLLPPHVAHDHFDSPR